MLYRYDDLSLYYASYSYQNPIQNSKRKTKMYFGSSKAFISKRKLCKAGYPSSSHKSKPAGPLHEIEEDKSRSASESLSSISDEELDHFESSEDEPMVEQPMPIRGKGFLGGSRGGRGKTSAFSKRGKAMEPLPKKPPPVAKKPALPLPLSADKESKGVRHKRQVDTNVISLNLSVLKDKTNIATGDPIICLQCKAMLNIHSKIETVEGQQVWKCEFCNSVNPVAIEKEELPQSDELTYVIQSAHQAMQDKEESKAIAEDVSIIFCIDTSGSMCVTQPVQGKVAVKYDKTKKLKEFLKYSDGSQQYMGKEKKNTTYISRMQCLQTAIEKQISDLSNGAPNRKVGIVTFNNEVCIIGDGLMPPKTVAGDKLNNYDVLLKEGMEYGDKYVSKNVKETKKSLINRLAAIEESGQTALGPALLIALGMAIKGKPGSKVILCTDGLANIGLGSVEDLSSEILFNETQGFYSKLGELAKSKGVCISLISLVSEECKLEMLSPLADLTAGDILKVDPLHLSSDFANILSESVIATNVDVRVKLHKGLTFRNENPVNLAENETLLLRHIGNAMDSQEVTFEYCIKPADKMGDLDFSKVTHLPFQTQISYTTLDGMKCVRLITKTQLITFEKEEAKKAANYTVLAVNAVQQSAKLADVGEHRAAQANAFQWKKMLRGSEQYKNYVSNVKPLYEALQRQQEDDVIEKEESADMKMKRKRTKKDSVVSYTNQARKMNKKKFH
eukprot:TRINITY_DN3238_c0_g1_i1.p1 TRINITY_DN3238_c0_g1~~TRINITY_DN3238_c0_g1_i1.p1  ORF type:complete len:731 (+),score=92.14 TRINITY_DN3238_c0_g1_i1:5000-7192(+)